MTDTDNGTANTAQETAMPQAVAPVVESASASTACQTTSSRKAYAICAGVLAAVLFVVFACIGLIYTGLTTSAAIESNSESILLSIEDNTQNWAEDAETFLF